MTTSKTAAEEFRHLTALLAIKTGASVVAVEEMTLSIEERLLATIELLVLEVRAMRHLLETAPWEVERLRLIQEQRVASQEHAAPVQAALSAGLIPATTANPVLRMYKHGRETSCLKHPAELTDQELLRLRCFGKISLARWRSVWPKPQ